MDKSVYEGQAQRIPETPPANAITIASVDNFILLGNSVSGSNKIANFWVTDTNGNVLGRGARVDTAIKSAKIDTASKTALASVDNLHINIKYGASIDKYQVTWNAPNATTGLWVKQGWHPRGKWVDDLDAAHAFIRDENIQGKLMTNESVELTRIKHLAGLGRSE